MKARFIFNPIALRVHSECHRVKNNRTNWLDIQVMLKISYLMHSVFKLFPKIIKQHDKHNLQFPVKLVLPSFGGREDKAKTKQKKKQKQQKKKKENRLKASEQYRNNLRHSSIVQSFWLEDRSGYGNYFIVEYISQ